MNLDTLMNKVIETKALENAQNTEELCNIIKNEVDLTNVKSWLSDLQKSVDEGELGTLASLMEVHPLGFEKYVLWEGGVSGPRARLHYWPENKWPFESIHNHRFHFCAIVVKGNYIHEEYEVNQLENNLAEITLRKKAIIKAGDTYFFSAGKFHRVIPSDELTVSFIVRGNPVLPYSSVINPETLEIKKAYGALKKFKNKLETLEMKLHLE